MINWTADIPFLRQYILPVLDIAILAVLIYQGYRILVHTRAVQLIKGAVFLGLLYVVAFIFNLNTLLWIMNLLAPSLVIALAIIFQPELRKIFTRIGQRPILAKTDNIRQYIANLTEALEQLSKKKWGALIVIVRYIGIKNIAEKAARLDAEISSALLVSIFNPTSPIHDGAAIIEDGRISVAGAFLPTSERDDLRSEFGSRHRAALGLAEESDSVILIVSEERGTISMGYEANIHYDMQPKEVRDRLNELLGRAKKSTSRRGSPLAKKR